MREREIEVLKKLVPDDNLFSCLDYSIATGDEVLLTHILTKHCNPEVRKIIGNNLLANVLEKAPTSAFVEYVLDNVAQSFEYVDSEGKTYKFLLEEKNNE